MNPPTTSWTPSPYLLDSGIKWNDRGAMLDLRRKTRLNRGEVPVPVTSRSTSLESGEDCSTYTSQYDANDDGVVNVVDYSCDPRVERDPAQRGGLGVGPSDLLDPQDILIAFSDGDDDDSNGFVDDMVGWDFLDTEMVTSGRPVVAQARSLFGVVASTRCAPRTPFSSRGSELTGSLPASLSAAYIQPAHSSPFCSPGALCRARV